MNQDGKTVGISMPSSEAQAALIRSLYKNAHLDPTEVRYVEAHGTGTTVGDPIEAAAFAATFATKAGPEAPVYIGSARSNFGHLEAVTGLVSIIEIVMMLEKGLILPNANFQTLNPKIALLGKSLKVGANFFIINLNTHWYDHNVDQISAQQPYFVFRNRIPKLL